MQKFSPLLLMGLLCWSLSFATPPSQNQESYPIEKIREQNQQIIKMVVDNIAPTLPQTVDQYTTITQIREENLTLIYTFEINAEAKRDEAIIKEDKARMEHAVIQGVCQSSQRFLKAGVNITYEYFSATTHHPLFSFAITPEVCQRLDDA